MILEYSSAGNRVDIAGPLAGVPLSDSSSNEASSIVTLRLGRRAVELRWRRAGSAPTVIQNITVTKKNDNESSKVEACQPNAGKRNRYSTPDEPSEVKAC